MAEPSAHALVCDLLGEDPSAPRPRRLPVARAARQCARGQVMAAADGDEPVCVVVLADGRGYVVPDRCPHDGGLLSDGFVDGDRLVCARHGWEFDAASGRSSGRPHVCLASRPLAGKRRKAANS